MAKTKRHSRFPGDKILDGTFLGLTKLDWQIFMVIALFMDYKTHDSCVSNRKIKELTYVTSNVEIKASVERLMDCGLIRTWLVPYIRKDGTESETQTKRMYHVRIGVEHKD